jgi:hypothetical protein
MDTMEESGPEIAQTHVSILFFVGNRAYKLKKPVRTPFLDFSTPEKRRAACLREVELNRRLAPDVYLGVADVTGPDGEGGTACDHLVVMRRMPPGRRLARQVAAEEDEAACLEEVARIVARFHAAAATSPAISAEGTRDAVRRRWEDNIAEMGRFAEVDPGVRDRIAGLARAYLAGRDALFDRRIREGRIVDGHGDLLADDIFCLDDGPRILDCLEFDDRLRYVDGLDDACCLAMDLEHLGGREAAGAFLTAYRREAADDHPASLAHHYIAYRAHMRAKVALLRHEQGEPEAAKRAARLLGLAERHLAAGEVRLVLVGGLPGTGKSTLARGIGHAMGWRVLRTDEVRDEVVPAQGGPGAGGYGSGRYAPEAVEATYAALLDRARPLLAAGEPVVLDGSWTSAERRAAAAALARRSHATLVPLRCVAPAEVGAARIEARRRRGGDPSEATPTVAGAMAAREEPWPEAAAIDTTTDEASSLRAALAVLHGPPTPRGE